MFELGIPQAMRLAAASVNSPARWRDRHEAHWLRATEADRDRGAGAAPGPWPRYDSLGLGGLQPSRHLEDGSSRRVLPVRRADHRRWRWVRHHRGESDSRPPEPAWTETPGALLGA